MTTRQKDVLDFIRSYQFQNCSSPTLKEICKAINVSSEQSVLKHLEALILQGKIEKGKNPRSIKPLPEVKKVLVEGYKNFLLAKNI